MAYNNKVSLASVPDFGAAKRRNTEYQNVYGAHRFVNHPSHEDQAANKAVYARQTYSTPTVRATWQKLDPWALQGLTTQMTGQQMTPRNKMVKLYGMDDFARRRKKDPLSEAMEGPTLPLDKKKGKPLTEETLYFNDKLGYATMGIGLIGLMALA